MPVPYVPPTDQIFQEDRLNEIQEGGEDIHAFASAAVEVVERATQHEVVTLQRQRGGDGPLVGSRTKLYECPT